MSLARRVAVIATLTVLSTLSVPLAEPALAASATSVENQLTELVNAERRGRGLPDMRVDVRLMAPAREWSAHMASQGRLSHTGDLRGQAPAGASAWAENVGMSSSPDAAGGLHAMFMASGGHRASILGNYTDVGIGVTVSGGRTWVTQRFTAGAPAPVAAAVASTAALTKNLFGGGQAQHAVIVRDDVFADALAGGPLAGDDGPILLNPPGGAVHPAVRSALEAVLPRGSTVWLAGGSAAVSDHVEWELDAAGWNVKRVAGPNRVETAARVAREVTSRSGRPARALVATAGDWPDAAAGGAYGAAAQAPILLSESDAVPAATAGALGEIRPQRVAALGGRAALSNGVVSQLGADRVSGPSRQGTSAAIAADLWGHRDASPRYWIAVPAYSADAWTWAVTAAPLAARHGAAVLLVGDDLASTTRDYVAGLGYGGGNSATLLTHGPVPGAAADQLRALLR